LKDGISVARDFEDYGVAVNRENLPQGVELQILGV
jgi:hypothetical protein